MRSLILRVAVFLLPVLALIAPSAAMAQSVDDDPIQTFFQQHGAETTFGQPITPEFTFQGQQTQVFELGALQQQADGSVIALPLASASYLPYTHFDGLTVPAPDGALAMLTPTSDQTNFQARLSEFVRAAIPDNWGGQPVAFGSMVSNAIDVWGMPLSTPAADPANPNFIYQRFSNGILMYDATTGTTQPLPLGSYFKALITGQGMPSDLASEAANSPLLARYAGDASLTF